MNRIICCLIFLGIGVASYAQPKDNSPFSRIGMGDIVSSDFASSQSMGRLSAVYHDFFESNISNPAAHGFLQYTSLQLGLYAKAANLSFNDEKSSVWSGNLEHISLGIPLVNPINELLERRETKFSWGMNFSLSPYSRVGYNIESTDMIDSVGQILQGFTGEGGTYKVMWGNGWKYKNFSAGLNMGYLYGKESFRNRTDFLDITNDFTNLAARNIQYKGFVWNGGLIYEHPLDLKKARENEENPSKLLSVGVTFSGNKSFNTSSEILNIALNEVFGNADTLVNETELVGNGVLPSDFSIGLMYREASKFKVGVNFTTESWSNYKNDARSNDILKNSFRVGGGIGWIPDATSISSYWKRLEYRFGLNFEKDPRVFNGEQLNNFGIHMGMGMPFFLQRQVSWLNVALELGRRGTPSGIKENYARLKVGVTLNDDKWFIQRKYN